MILLDGHTLTPWLYFAPESQSLTLVEPGVSTSTITIGPDAPEISVGDWLLDETGPGKGIVWSVKGVETVYDKDTRTVQLEHVIATLKDVLMFGDLGGRNASAETMARTVLGYQSVWTLGRFEFDRTLPYQFNNQTVYQALETISGTLKGWRWTYDLTSLPFVLNIVKKSDRVDCEMRSTRNLITIKKTVDKTNMYTRFYPVGARNIHIKGDYVSANEGVFGVIAKTETDQSISNRDLLQAWAEEKLADHCEPSVTIQISGLELSAATGEPLDRLTLGTVCRVPLPEFQTTITERITKLSWSDKIKDPERVTVTLANQLTDVATILKQSSGSSARNAGGAAKTQEEDHAWIVDTTDHVSLVAEAIIGKDGEEVDWSRVSEIIVDGEGIHQRVVKAQGDIVTNSAAIEVNEQGITHLVTKTGVDGLKDGETLYTRITQSATDIQQLAIRTEAVEGDITTLHGSALWQSRDHITAIAGKFEQSANGDLRLRDGAQLQVRENGVYQTVGTVKDIEDGMSVITGSQLWQTRNAITGVVGKMEVDGNNIRLKDGAQIQVKRNGVFQTVGTVDYTDSRMKEITGSTLWQTRDSITGVVGKMEVSGSNLRLKSGTQLQVKKDGVFETVGTVEYTDRQMSAITGSALWRTRDSITGVVGKMEVSGNNLRLKDGTQLQVKRNGAFQTVGTVDYIDGQMSTITGSALWQTRNAITGVVGKMEVDGDNVRLKDGAQLQVRRNGVYQTVGTVDYIDSRHREITGSSLWTQRDSITGVVGKMEVNGSNLRLKEGAQLQVKEDGVYHTVGTVAYVNSQMQSITGSALWQSRNAITGVVGKMEVSGNNVRLKDGAQLQVRENGVYHTVGTTDYVDDQMQTIKGSALWTNRDSITGVVGMMEVDGTNLRVAQGAQLQIEEDGVYHTVGTVDYIDDCIEEIEGSALFTLEDQIIGVAGSFTVDGSHNVTLQEGAKLQITRDGITSEVVDRDNVKSSINQSAEAVSISASKINLDGYVTARELSTQKARIDNLINGTTLATKLVATTGNFTNANLGTANGGVVKIMGQQVRVYSFVDTSGNTHHCFGYT